MAKFALLWAEAFKLKHGLAAYPYCPIFFFTVCSLYKILKTLQESEKKVHFICEMGMASGTTLTRS